MKIRITGVRRSWPYTKDEPYENEFAVEPGWVWITPNEVIVQSVEVIS